MGHDFQEAPDAKQANKKPSIYTADCLPSARAWVPVCPGDLLCSYQQVMPKLPTPPIHPLTLYPTHVMLKLKMCEEK
eukprot:1161120-Pelagomonas_calceolata.AAC.5